MGAENGEKALEYATDKVTFGDFEMDEAIIEKSIPDEELERSKVHAHVISEPED